jgi:hypothetical protein
MLRTINAIEIIPVLKTRIKKERLRMLILSLIFGFFAISTAAAVFNPRFVIPKYKIIEVKRTHIP